MVAFREFSAVFRKEARLCVALFAELNVASRGETVEDAFRNIKEKALVLYMEDAGVEKL